MAGLSQSQCFPGELDQRVLKAAAGSEERDPLRPGMGDRGQRRRLVGIRTRRHHPDTGEPGQPAGCLGSDCIRVNPFPGESGSRLVGQLHRPVDPLVGDHR
jgi:hypothetical protein